MEKALFVLFHVPSGMYADQDSVEKDGTILTCGVAYTSRDDAEEARESLAKIRCNVSDWAVVEKPCHVSVNWVV